MRDWVRYEAKQPFDREDTTEKLVRIELIQAVQSYEHDGFSGIAIIFYDGDIDFTESYDIDGFIQNVLEA